VTAVSTALFVLIAMMAFLAGITIGVVLIVSLAIRREDRLFPLWSDAPGLMSRGARRVVGYRVKPMDRF
jgi:hypothetical protein